MNHCRNKGIACLEVSIMGPPNAWQAHRLQKFVLKRPLLYVCRNEKLAIQVLAESTLAAQEAVIQYLAAAAGLQQWGQASLAFLTLQKSEHGLSTHQLSEAIESTLEDSFRVRDPPVRSHWLAQSTIPVCGQRLGIFSGRGYMKPSLWLIF